MRPPLRRRELSVGLVAGNVGDDVEGSVESRSVPAR